MVTTTIYNGKLTQMGFKHGVARNVAGYTVDIAVSPNGFDDYVLDIMVALNNQKLSNETLAEINAEIERTENEILAIFGY